MEQELINAGFNIKQKLFLKDYIYIVNFLNIFNLSYVDIRTNIDKK